MEEFPEGTDPYIDNSQIVEQLMRRMRAAQRIMKEVKAATDAVPESQQLPADTVRSFE